MFYTYVTQLGNNILHRWVDDDGERHSELTEFDPTLYVQSGDTNAQFRGIRKERLEPVKLGGIQEARDFIKKSKDISNFKIFGNNNWWAQFINEEYTGDVEWDVDKLVVANLDIECFISDPDNPGLNPLNNPIEGVNPITAITVEVNGEYVVFGSKVYPGDPPLNAKPPRFAD